MAQKNPNIRSINRIGKIMKILLRIGQVFTVLGFICIAGLMILVMWLPVDDVTIRSSFHVDVDYKTEDFKTDNSDLQLNNKKHSFDIEDIAVKLYTKTHSIDSEMSTLSIDGDVEEISGNKLRFEVMKELIIYELFLIASFIAITFGAKFSKALQLCETPFCDEVIKHLTRFGKSLIPLGIIALFTDLVSVGIIMPLLILLLFIRLFKYGAELQKKAGGV
jgi:hypothetical protein